MENGRVNPGCEFVASRSDLDELAGRYQASGRLMVNDVLRADWLLELRQAVAAWREWALVTRVAGKHYSFDAVALDAMPEQQRAPLLRLVYEEARSGFQYLFERYPLYDHGRMNKLADPVLQRAYQMICSEGFLELGRAITGRPDIEFADGQITRYRRGHFLTLHTDQDSSMKRVAAYVLHLSEDWRPDFGGQLQFVNQDGAVEACFVPSCNSMSVFEVPVPHLVSVVPEYVDRHRMAITGWFRAEPPPDLPSDPVD